MKSIDEQFNKKCTSMLLSQTLQKNNNNMVRIANHKNANQEKVSPRFNNHVVPDPEF